MTPIPPTPESNTRDIKRKQKSWQVMCEERKTFKKQRKQAKILKKLDSIEQSKKELLIENSKEKLPPRQNPSTISIAVPGSILENAQSAELRSYVAGQIARAACIFRVNEVIVFDDMGVATVRQMKHNYEVDNETTINDGVAVNTTNTVRSSSLQLARILQLLECPQYLRKFFFPMHKDLKYSGLLNPLDAPHHLRQQNIFPYREGIIMEKAAKPGYSYANVGLLNDVLVNKAIPHGMRVTVKLEPKSETKKKQRGTIVSPDEPRRETGVYWGYNVRIAHSFSEILTKSPYAGGYDLTIGTSDKGVNVQNIEKHSFKYQHLLIIFGGIKGLEEAIVNDDKLSVDDPELLFDHYLNVLPRQGSRTIRTEEALLIAMSALQEKFKPQVPDIEEELIVKNLLPRSEDTGIKMPMPEHQPNQKKQKKRENAVMQQQEQQQHQQHQQHQQNQQQPTQNWTVENNKEVMQKNDSVGVKFNPFRDKDTKTQMKQNNNIKVSKMKMHINNNINDDYDNDNDNDYDNDDDAFEIVTAETKIKSTLHLDNNLDRFD